MVFPPVFGPTLFQTVDIPMICGKSTMIILIGMRRGRNLCVTNNNHWYDLSDISVTSSVTFLLALINLMGGIWPYNSNLRVICRKIQNKYESEDKFI